MDNERDAIERAKPPAGYALAFDGEPIKKCCNACIYFQHDQEYQYHWYDCNLDTRIANLKGFPFPNGCKHFDLHWEFTVDWDAEARRMDEEKAICEYLSGGKCYSYGWKDCDSAVSVDEYTRECKKALPESE
jgi:hypothetical protein